ncbi:VanW family protein [Corynebacterium sp. TA-R-1]|uniref:VanW family protein n=1 Tax=Corynebacterium stercoris TaxID=2943490 RepID=A0ABT1G4D0_9CORY|nr:VanW family protein [Corynebacterium stercoris]MCP1387572.1 VanW family protein [Corynebacterium stercoris]
MNRGTVPRGTTVGGVAIGGMQPDEAEATLQRELGGVEDKPVEIKAGSKRAQLTPSKAGLGIDWQATVDAAGEESLNPFTRIAGFFRTHEVDAVAAVDEAKLEPALNRTRRNLTLEPKDGAITIDAGKAVIQAPEPGQEVDYDALHERVTHTWLNPDGVKVEPTVIQPAVDDAAIKAAQEGPVRAALNGPLILRGAYKVDAGDAMDASPEGDEAAGGADHGPVAASVPQDRLGEIVQFPVREGKLTPEINREVAQAILGEQLADTETEKRNARVLAGGGVEPSVDGYEIDWEATFDKFDDRVLGTLPREWDATYQEVAADFTTEDAQNATFNQVVGSFTTGGYSAASGENIAVVARTVNGAIVNPGETFSLNGYTGPRGTAQGYVESGIILNGRADKAVGGGISQFATTLYNAAYFAGMTDIAHTPHSYYISRYPAGREATVYEGAIDLQFRNDSAYPVKITTSVGGGQVTVSLMGVKTVNVESVNGGRWAQTEPKEQTVTDSSCIASSGTPGFTTSDTRIIYDLAGNELSRETQTTVYNPQPIVKCG